MFTEAIVYQGIDVAKDSLECNGTALSGQVKNEVRCVRRTLEKWKRGHPGLHIVCEPSGGYERVLISVAHALKIPISLVNARQVRDFARSIGRLEKTDKVDADVLRLYGEKIQPKSTEPISPQLHALQEWVQTRDYYVEQQRAETNRLEQIDVPELQKVIRAQLRHLGALLEKIEKRIDAFIQEQAPELEVKVQTLCLVQGVGTLTAISLIAHLPELGQLSGPAITKLAGLAPICSDSGTWRGRRSIRHGRSAARRALFLAALVAARWNDHLRPVYQRLRAAGKPPKVALIAVARKLLLFLNKLLSLPRTLPS